MFTMVKYGKNLSDLGFFPHLFHFALLLWFEPFLQCLRCWSDFLVIAKLVTRYSLPSGKHLEPLIQELLELWRRVPLDVAGKCC